MMNTPIQKDKRSFAYGRKIIDYSLYYCKRKTMEITVHPEGAVIVKAPMDSDIPFIEKKLNKRARWIIKQLNYFKQFSPKTPSRCYVNGETHLYLGKHYRLKITVGTDNSIKLSRGFFRINCGDEPTPEMIQKLLNKWYLEKASLQFNNSMERCWPKFKRFNLT